MPRASIQRKYRKYLHPLVRCLSFCHALHSPFDEQTVPPPFIFIDYTVSHNVILFLFYCRYNTSLSHNTIVRMMMMNPIILIIKWYLPPVPGYKAGAGGGWPQSAPTWGTAGSWSSSYRSNVLISSKHLLFSTHCINFECGITVSLSHQATLLTARHFPDRLSDLCQVGA